MTDLAARIKQEAQTLGFDATGMGEQMAEYLSLKYGDRVEAMKFTQQSKGTLATLTKSRMQVGTVRFLYDRDASAQMHSIDKSVTKHGNIIYTSSQGAVGPSGNKHHADKFWARALGVYAWADVAKLPPLRVDFI